MITKIKLEIHVAGKDHEAQTWWDSAVSYMVACVHFGRAFPEKHNLNWFGWKQGWEDTVTSSSASVSLPHYIL